MMKQIAKAQTVTPTKARAVKTIKSSWRWRLMAGLAGSFMILPGALADAAELNGIRFANNINRTQVILDLTSQPDYRIFPLTNPNRLMVDLQGTQLDNRFIVESIAANSLVTNVRHESRGANGLRIVMDLAAPVSSRALPLEPAGLYGHRLLIELVGQQALATQRSAEIGNYIVARGDTLFSISQRFGVTVAELRAINNKRDNALEVGDRLQIPAQSRPTSVAVGQTATPVRLAEGGWQHQVSSGDTLFSISQRYGVDLNNLRAANQMQNNDIRVGDVLLVPSTPLTDPSNDGLRRHQVQSGDTLFSLSQRYSVPVSAIQSANNLRSTLLELGSQIVIPEPGTSATPVVQPSYAHGSTTRHTVAQGENLFQIARRYRISIVRLRRANGLDSDSIQIGEDLIIPPRVQATAQTDVYRQ